MSQKLKTKVSFPAPSSPMETWYNTVHKGTMKHMPIEAALSFPIPLKTEDRLVLAAFYYGTRPGNGLGQGTTLPPIAKIVAEYPSGRLIKYLRKSAAHLFPGISVPEELGPLVTQKISPAERTSVRKALFALYPTVIEAYTAGNKIDQREQFFKLFTSLIAPGLMPFYQALNLDFFVWLSGV
jgi:hypothetical protein